MICILYSVYVILSFMRYGIVVPSGSTKRKKMSEWEICDLVHIAPISYACSVHCTVHDTVIDRWFYMWSEISLWNGRMNSCIHLQVQIVCLNAFTGSHDDFSTNSIKTTLKHNFPVPAKPSPQSNAIYLRESTIRIQTDNRIDFSANNIFRSLSNHPSPRPLPPLSLYPF